MRWIRQTLTLFLCAGMLSFAAATPAPAQSILTGAFGAFAGTATGGYVTLSIVVARAQAGHYLHDVNDLFHWQSTPVLIGAVTGSSVGFFAPDRFWSGFFVGAIGVTAGAGIGWLVGSQISNRPEGRWAGAAIGSGAGVAIGTILGILIPQEQLVPEFLREKQSTVVPIGFTVRF